MELKTYFWNNLKVSRYEYLKKKILKPQKIVFKYGNSGDIFNIDLIKYLYKDIQVKNLRKQENRLMLVGSTMSVLERGDIVNGIGWKGNDLSHIGDVIASAKIFGVRGPLTKSLFEKYGADLSSLKFELDPGLLIKEVLGLSTENNTNRNVIFIPHFNDINAYKGIYPKDIKVVNIDTTPCRIAKEIQKAKVVYSSSLHGIIFSHALNKECVFVKPQSEEPLFKYRDYYMSIGQEMPEPVKDIYSYNFKKDDGTILKEMIGIDDFFFPSIDVLKQNKVIV